MAHTPRNQSEKATLAARRAWCYLVLVLISFLCLFFFYVLVINSTRTHFEIQKGFSLLPGGAFVTNLNPYGDRARGNAPANFAFKQNVSFCFLGSPTRA